MSTQVTGWNDTSNNSPWLDYNFPVLNEHAIKAFTEYSKIPEQDLSEHITKARELAWKDSPFPCVGLWFFTQFEITRMAEYDEIVKRMRNGQTFIDLGCGMGQDLRLLAAEGVPTTSLYGSDLKRGLWDIGYDLFRDRADFKAEFIQADIFTEWSKLARLEGCLDIVQCADFMHLFDLPQQMILAKQILSLLKRQPGSLIVGRQLGTRLSPRFHTSAGGTTHRHTPESMQQMWHDAASEMGLVVQTTASLAEYLTTGRDSASRGMDADPLVRVIFSTRLV